MALSVADNGVKLRLILDLSWLNQFLVVPHFSLPSVDRVVPVLPPGGFMSTFDFKNGYHHVDIREEDLEYLGFSWPMDGKKTFCVHCAAFWFGASAIYFHQVISSFDGEVGCAGHPSMVVLGRWPCCDTRLQKLCEDSGSGERGFEKGGGVRVAGEVRVAADAGDHLARHYLLLSTLKIILCRLLRGG
jgi:hypothetical protein